MAETVPEATVHEVDEILGSGIDKLKETIANEDEKIDNRIGALLLLLRSRRNVEENMQVDAHPASPQLSESPDFNRPDPKPSHVINVTPEIPKASSLSTRRYKLHRRVSLEEINERRLKGLCVFCNELETPNHHLKHKNLGILMIDGDEDQLPNGELSVTIEHRMVNLVQEAREENPKLENHKDLVEKAILEEESIPQFQVPISDSENLRNIELREENSKLETLEYVVMNENEKLEQDGAQKYVNRKFEVDGDVERSQKVLSSPKNCCAHQVFGKMSKHEEKLGIKKKRKGFKSRMFKYKRGLRKLHTLTFSKSMSMVFSQPLGMVETSSDLLMWNGKDSLPRTAIGSELEALTEEEKGYFDRFQSLVLMKGITDSSSNDEELMKEEDSLKVYEVHRETQIVDSGQWLGYDLIITCLENKNNWTKLRVKKWENLCWKEAASDESRSISICCIMKLGGMAFIYKNVLERIHNEIWRSWLVRLCWRVQFRPK
ncbi:hypothetical protein ISN45_Aa03g031560 [Arabidopsis thaliana x Arabidopsis arenosa]|uniref:Uncharacterized protein n=1 Tax=Arabidopsis thaliana x Arabidopsis arenosa TaxID=1240361 RepID=A0A8T2AYZ8_9BRAS|nr:hypothetical protein ISN45_Aa03g031560 [Arabidopsis thaliana x Arabidopsis arenosa]